MTGQGDVAGRLVETADRAAAWFLGLAQPFSDALIESVIYALADLQCDLANGDHVDAAAYRDDAAAAVGAVIEHLAWTKPVAALAVAEQQRDDALAKVARVEAALEANHRKWKLAGLSAHDFALHHVIDAALTDPRPPGATPTAETVPPRVAGTGGPQNPAQSRGGGE